MNKNKTVGVVVLGDIDRSPRMKYHSYSLNREGFPVKLLGYHENKMSRDLTLNGVEIVSMKQAPLLNAPRLLQFFVKVIWNTLLLFYTLVLHGRFQILLIQNPPSIPTLFVCWLYCKIFRAQFIIDWHNYAYTILALNVGCRSLLVRISIIFEKYFGRLANHNLCVTRAMKEDLNRKWNIEAVMLYDKPGPCMVSKISDEEKKALFTKLSIIYKEFENMLSDSRNGLLVSSTSWTEDEDFSILLDALLEYDKLDNENYPCLLCVITGKGPLKTFYEEKIKKEKWKKVKIITPWLESEDYPRLLACADLGVCLHTSSSGLDLPMKVVDMFGCGLPVCAYDYQCLSELVRHNENGLVFQNSLQLAEQLQSWFRNFPQMTEQRVKLRENIKNSRIGWHDNWRKNAMPLFER